MLSWNCSHSMFYLVRPIFETSALWRPILQSAMGDHIATLPQGTSSLKTAIKRKQSLNLLHRVHHNTGQVQSLPLCSLNPHPGLDYSFACLTSFQFTSIELDGLLLCRSAHVKNIDSRRAMHRQSILRVGWRLSELT